MPTIEIPSRHGLPAGTYDIWYWRLTLDRRGVELDTNYDADVSAEYVERLRRDRRMPSDEIVDAVCRSQPGGIVICGSKAAAATWRRWGLAEGSE